MCLTIREYSIAGFAVLALLSFKNFWFLNGCGLVCVNTILT